MRRRTLLLCCVVTAAGCSATPTAPPAPTPRGQALTLLYTSDEHGWIHATTADGVRRGGVEQFLADLTEREHHCTGSLAGAPLPDCRDSETVLLSGGDNFTGPAISSFFHGESMAESMRRLGYATAAFGNHEMDFGRAQFVKNRAITGMSYVAANLRATNGGVQDLTESFVVVERGAVKLGVIGLATVSTPEAADKDRFQGLAFDDLEATLTRVVPEVWKEGVDAIVVLAHECHDVVTPIVAAHPEWKLSFVGTGHCHRTSVELVANTPVIAPDWRLQHYARVRLSVDRDRPDPKERASVVGYELVDIVSATSAPEPAVDLAFAKRVDAWDAQVATALGEVIGYTAVGLAKKSVPLGQWIVSSWRAAFAVDLAITTEGAIRQELPPGDISMRTIASIMPFENELVVCTVPGDALATMLGNPEAIVAGLTRDATGTWVDTDGKPIDPKKRYRVVTSDFLFNGGDGFSFHRYDATPVLTGVNWRSPVVEWTKKAATSRQRPLEAMLSEMR